MKPRVAVETAWWGRAHPPHPPRPPFGRRSPPVPHTSRSGGGQTWRWLGGWCFALLEGRAERGNTPPASSLTLVAAPQVWWASWRGFERRGSLGHPRETHRKSRSAPTQNTNVQQATSPPPVLGGQRRSAARRGGLVLALCTTCNKKPTKPGGQRRASARKRGVCSRNLQNRHDEQNANVSESQTGGPPTAQPTPSLPPS